MLLWTLVIVIHSLLRFDVSISSSARHSYCIAGTSFPGVLFRKCYLTYWVIHIPIVCPKVLFRKLPIFLGWEKSMIYHYYLDLLKGPTGGALDCRSTGWVIDLAPGPWFIQKIHLICSGCPQPSIALQCSSSMVWSTIHFICFLFGWLSYNGSRCACIVKRINAIFSPSFTY